MDGEHILVVFLSLVIAAICFIVLRGVRAFLSGVREGYSEKPPRRVTRESTAPSFSLPDPSESPTSESARTRVSERESSYKSIFISYRREDSQDVTGRIYDRLVSEFGRDCIFKDVDSLPFGEDFRNQLDAAVAKAAILIAVIGPRWFGIDPTAGTKRLDDSRDFVRIEILVALERDIPVIPVLVLGATMPAESDLPEQLKNLAYRNAVHVRPDPDFHNDVDRLVKGILRLFSH